MQDLLQWLQRPQTFDFLGSCAKHSDSWAQSTLAELEFLGMVHL